MRTATDCYQGLWTDRTRTKSALNGDDRNPMVVQAAVNITLWLMVHRLPQQMGVERRQLLYEESVQWLKDIQAGKASPGLPTYVSDDGSDDDTHNPIRYGCVPPSKYDW